MRARVAGCLLALVLPLVGCGGPPREPAAGPAVEGQEYEHDLSTHCGIFQTRFAGSWWVTEPELHDGSHNPPAGWDQPQQRGTMRLLGPGQAEFRDDSDHVVLFTRRPGADPPRICA